MKKNTQFRKKIKRISVFILLILPTLFMSCSDSEQCNTCQEELTRVRSFMESFNKQALQVASVMDSLNSLDSLSTMGGDEGFDADQISGYIEAINTRRSLAEAQINQINAQIKEIAGVDNMEALVTSLQNMRNSLESKKREIEKISARLAMLESENQEITGKYNSAKNTIREKDGTISQIEQEKKDALASAEEANQKADKSEKSLQARKLYDKGAKKLAEADGISIPAISLNKKKKEEKINQKTKLLNEAISLFVEANSLGHSDAAYQANTAREQLKKLN
jgi:chromosome segregation ATPase